MNGKGVVSKPALTEIFPTWSLSSLAQTHRKVCTDVSTRRGVSIWIACLRRQMPGISSSLSFFLSALSSSFLTSSVVGGYTRLLLLHQPAPRKHSSVCWYHHEHALVAGCGLRVAGCGLYCTALHCTALHCTALHTNQMWR